MKTWSTRITAGLAVGAAAAVLPLAATPALAADWVTAGGGYSSKTECVDDGNDYITHDYHDFSEFTCEESSSGDWTMYVR